MKHAGDLKINMQQFRKRWKICSDNVKYAEAIQLAKGDLFVLDSRPYIELLADFNVFFTFTPEGYRTPMQQMCDLMNAKA